MIPPHVLIVGQLFGVALACGLNLYITVAVLGLGSRLGFLPQLPLGLRGLETGLVIGTALALYLIEAVADKVPYLDSLWDVVHTFIRPPAAALLALGALTTQPVELQLAAAAFAGAAALAAHGVKAGLRLSIYACHRRIPSGALSLAEDVLAVGLVVSVLLFPSAALVLVGGCLLLVLLIGPRLWRAFLLGMRAFAARVRAFFGPSRWSEAEALPGDLRALVTEVASPAPARAARAALNGWRGVGDFRNGWLVVTPDSALFLYRSLLRPRRVVLSSARCAGTRQGVLADSLELETGGRRCTLFLLKDGPSAELAAAELTPLSG